MTTKLTESTLGQITETASQLEVSQEEVLRLELLLIQGKETIQFTYDPEIIDGSEITEELSDRIKKAQKKSAYLPLKAFFDIITERKRNGLDIPILSPLHGNDILQYKFG